MKVPGFVVIVVVLNDPNFAKVNHILCYRINDKSLKYWLRDSSAKSVTVADMTKWGKKSNDPRVSSTESKWIFICIWIILYPNSPVNILYFGSEVNPIRKNHTEFLLFSYQMRLVPSINKPLKLNTVKNTLKRPPHHSNSLGGQGRFEP